MEPTTARLALRTSTRENGAILRVMGILRKLGRIPVAIIPNAETWNRVWATPRGHQR